MRNSHRIATDTLLPREPLPLARNVFRRSGMVLLRAGSYLHTPRGRGIMQPYLRPTSTPMSTPSPKATPIVS